MTRWHATLAAVWVILALAVVIFDPSKTWVIMFVLGIIVFATAVWRQHQDGAPRA